MWCISSLHYSSNRGFRIKRALNIFINQCKYPGKYNECFCLSCSVKENNNQGTCFVDDNDIVNNNDNDNDNDKVNDKNNDKGNDNDNVNDNDNDKVKVNDQGTCFADNDKDIDENVYLRSRFIGQGRDEVLGSPVCSTDGLTLTKQNLRSCSTDPRSGFNDGEDKIFTNINRYLQPWLDDDDINVEAIFPENFRCIISSPSECGRTFLSKELIMINIYFDRLYIICLTGDQYEDVKC